MTRPTVLDTLRSFFHPKVITMLFLGISAGIPILLIFSSLGLWLREAGVERASVTLFSWAALGYSFKFTWAPLVDKLPVPLLTRILGKRRAWLLLSQLGIIVAIVAMAFVNPAEPNNLKLMAAAAILLGFTAATQDIVIDAYRIESAHKDSQALMSSTYIAGYRIGMLIAGAGALFLAGVFGSEKGAYHYQAWFNTYLIMAITMFIGILTTLIISEPDEINSSKSRYSNQDYSRLFLVFLLAIVGFILFFALSDTFATTLKKFIVELVGGQHLVAFLIEILRLIGATLTAVVVAIFSVKLKVINPIILRESYVSPILDFFNRYHLKTAILLLALVGLYRISDIVLGVIANVFYQDLGFSKFEIAKIVKSFGLLMTIIGGFFGGLIAVRYGVMRILLLGAILSVATNLLFIVLAKAGHDTSILYFVISADNLTAGIAATAFIAFLSMLTNIKFTATQYAIFSSLMTLTPKILGGYSGAIVDNIGYENFFWFASIIGIPIIFLVMIVSKSKDFR